MIEWAGFNVPSEWETPKFPCDQPEMQIVIIGAFLSLAVLLGGCGSRNILHEVHLDSKRISETQPLIVTLRPTECYYWVNSQNELCLAMRAEHRSLLGPAFEDESELSFVLEGLPAAESRDYSVNRRTFRARRRAGLHHVRSCSLSGVVGVWDFGKSKLRGRYRLTARQQTYSVLTGWTGNARTLFVGEFSAVPGETQGRLILDRTEEGALARIPLPELRR